MSTRRFAAPTGNTLASVHHTSQEKRLYPNRFQSVQELVAHDEPARRPFCQWILQQSAEDLTFAAKVLFKDESCFTRTGITKSHKEYVRSDENPCENRSHN
jgi:hypothetical protein